MTITVYGRSNPLVCVAVLMLMFLLVVNVLIEPGMNPFALAVEVAVDLIAFFLEVTSLAISALLCRMGSLLIEAAFNAITPGIQTLFYAFAPR